MSIYTNFEEVVPAYRGDDIVIPKPYAGIVVCRDGKYIIAGREKGRLVMVDGCNNDLVICSGDPLSLRHDYEKLICYGIALHVGETTVYLLVGEEGSTELYIVRIEIVDDPIIKKHTQFWPYEVTLEEWIATGGTAENWDDCRYSEAFVATLSAETLAAMEKWGQGKTEEIIDSITHQYKFEWKPAFDIRLPSVVAKNVDYDTPYLIKWTDVLDETDPAQPDEQMLKYDANGIQWITHLLRYQNDGKVICKWEHLKDELAVNLTDFPMLGPILPEYKPSIASVGARVMVTCTNVQLYVACFDMAVWFEDAIDADMARQYWIDFIHELIEEQGWPLDEEPDDITGIIPGPTWEDYFPEGKGKTWWMEHINEWIDGVPQGYKGSWVHFKVLFQYPFPISSVVTIYPDLGMIEGISHVGSALVCAMPTEGEVGHPWKGEWSYPLSLDHSHADLHNFFPTNIIAAEAELNLHWARNNYIVPANVLTWPDEEPWEDAGETVPDAFKAFLKWWHKAYLKQCKLDPVAEVRRLQPEIDDRSTAMTDTFENVLCQTHRDSALAAINVSKEYDFTELSYPWSVIEGVQQGFVEICDGTVMVVEPERILRGTIALYKLTTKYKGKVNGEGLDIYVGKVIIDQPKVVEVTFSHNASVLPKMRNITISIVADGDYPYYRFAKLSMDGTTWSDSINYPDYINSPNMNNPMGASSFTFYAKVECDATNEDPKPIRVAVAYERVGA